MKKFNIFLLLSILLCFGFGLSFEVHASGPNPYLTFQSTSSFTLKTDNNQKNWNGTLYYSTDTTTWNVWSGTTTLSSVGNKLYLRGTSNTVITGNSSDYKWVLTGSNIECIGNIENLLDYETVALGNHPTMANYCYYSMFSGCTGLTTAPSLPATTLTDYCYQYMFIDCTGLTTAPSLPATALAQSCYRNMFGGCTGLTTAPSLPATTLAVSCYYSMFMGCTGLTTAPSLPATTLANYCYYSMFYGCTALKVSTTQTETYQYAWRIPTSGTGTTATDWNKDMLKNTGGTFKGNPSIDTTYYVENPPVAPVVGFNITFEENGGTTQTDLSEQTALPNPLPTPTKTGYTFVGWYYDSAFTQKANAGDTIENNVTLYAKWEVAPSGYSITFEENGGTSVTDLTDQTTLPTPLPTPTKSGYTFAGWYYDSSQIYEAFAGDSLTDDVTLYAKWLPGKLFEVDEVLPATTALKIYIKFGQGDYHVETDDPNGIYLTIDWIGGVKDYYLEIGGVLQHDGVTSADEIYYTIDISNWSSSQRTIKSVSSENGIFVTWEDLAPAPSGYSITFEENGGTTQTDLTEQTALPDPLPIPTKENHVFVGWYYDSSQIHKAFAGDPLTDDVTLYARWLAGKLFEEDEVLPATTELKIRILFHEYGDYHVETDDPNGIYLTIDWIGGVKDYYLEIGGVLQHDGVTSAESIIIGPINISNWSSSQRTIKSVSSENGIFVTWEDATPDGYTQGYLTAREEFGYYDSRTNQWLSVDEYLDLYGTDKPGQSDFYGNFDKYFIPAMIIVFGGAIVLTVLKVFKGRE